MTTKLTRRLAPLALAVIGASLISGCGSSTTAGPTSDAAVTIIVNDKPTAERPEELAAYERNVKAFTALHPNVTVEGDESAFDVSTFQALLAGGQLPTTYYVPFTEMQGLIARQQVADIAGSLGAYDILSKINPAIMKNVQSADGGVYGIPTNAYTMGLLYNRDLFVKAGLDPDSPPTTWDEVRADAKAIEAATDAQGFASMTTENAGGWVLTTASYGFGATLESEDGTKATVDNAATKAVLDFYRQLRWEDNTFGSNFLLSYGDAMNAFAAGSIGMFVQGADAYASVVQNKGMSADAFGVGPLPQAADGLGTLGGGTVAIINPTADAAQVTAALQWIEFVKFQKYTDQAAAVADAKASAADGLAVGTPGLPILNKATNDQYLTWIAEYINVPRENYTAYLDSAETLPLVPEPAAGAQELYGILDPVVQAVLTRQDADIDALLGDAQKAAQAVIDAG